ncbi:MAG: hypothetical protein ACI8WB_002374 [Phenylobacterium sp.]|jgi:hypothetical protein
MKTVTSARFSASLLSRTSVLAIPLLSASLLSGCVIHIDTSSRPSEHYSQQLSLPASHLNQLNIDADAGDLRIVGVVGLETIEVKADIWTYDGNNNGDGYELTLTKRGHNGGAQLTASHDSHFDFGQSARIDLEVRMPAKMALKIDDGSGDISINHINAKVIIEDGSGSIEVVNQNDDLTIDDGSGSINITNLVGNVEIVDGSGGIEVSHITGDVTIEDSSGDIQVSHVSQAVKIEDGSGDIDITAVNTLEIGESGSGDVNVHDGE